jgi:hypothetical protein
MNINEKFLLALLEDSDFVHCERTEPEFFYFYPKNIDIEIKIPFSHSSTHINIHFLYNTEKSGNEIINFSIDSPDEIKEFMKLLYKKYQDKLNETYPPLSQDVINIFEDMLRHPIDDNYPYSFDGSYDTPYIEEKNKTSGCCIYVYEGTSNKGNTIKFKPLEPICLPCYYSNGKDDSESKYYKVIPAYLINEYPALSGLIKMNHIVKNTNELSDVLYSLSGDLAPKLNTLILDLELAEQHKSKKNKSKL